jgi:hypothetical protein
MAGIAGRGPLKAGGMGVPLLLGLLILVIVPSFSLGGLAGAFHLQIRRPSGC